MMTATWHMLRPKHPDPVGRVAAGHDRGMTCAVSGRLLAAA